MFEIEEEEEEDVVGSGKDYHMYIVLTNIAQFTRLDDLIKHSISSNALYLSSFFIIRRHVCKKGGSE